MTGAAEHAGRLRSWLFGTTPVQVMVLNRIVLGGVLFLHAASRVPEFGVLYGGSSVAWSAPHRELVSTFLAPDSPVAALAVVSGLAQLDEASRQLVLWALYGGLLASSLAFCLGLFTRAAGATAIALHLLFVAIHPFAHYGWASMVAPFALTVVLSRAGDYLSVDRFRERLRGHLARASVGVPAWPMRLLQVHVAAMYFHSGFARIDDPDWLQGEVLFEALSRALFTRFTLDLHALLPALQLLSYATFLLEPLAAVLLWIPRVRTLCALALIAMHVILELLTNVGWWNFIMIAGLLAFLPPAWVRRMLPLIGEERASDLRPARRR